MSVEIKPGYKMTDGGVIPVDWMLTSIGSIAESIIGGGTPSRSIAEYWDGEIPWMTVKDFATHDPARTMEYITQEGLKNSASKMIPKHTIIISTRMGLGKAVIFNVDVAINQDLKAIFVKKDIDTKFLFHWFKFNELCIAKMGSGSTVMGLSLSDLRKIPFAKPPLSEQCVIATALSDTDALIESLEQLIAKKRQIKQGMMQVLLKPKESWNQYKISDLMTIMHGKSQHAVADSNGIYPILATGGQIGTAKHFLYDKPSVLIGRKGTIDRPQYMTKPFWSVDTLFYTIIHEPYIPKYLFYQFCLIDWRKYNEASGVPSLSARTIGQIELKLPPVAEQEKISNILSDLDVEIEILEAKLSKIKNIKQGMMQNLFIGKLRLV